jgi:hypothetical protein
MPRLVSSELIFRLSSSHGADGRGRVRKSCSVGFPNPCGRVTRFEKITVNTRSQEIGRLPTSWRIPCASIGAYALAIVGRRVDDDVRVRCDVYSVWLQLDSDSTRTIRNAGADRVQHLPRLSSARHPAEARMARRARPHDVHS